MKYFTDPEFYCACKCGTGSIATELALRLDKAREIAGIPFIITSGYRCPKHNKAVGSKITSSHVLGLAVDISTPNSATRFAVLCGLVGAGFTRIGVGSDFVHADVDRSKSKRVAWVY